MEKHKERQGFYRYCQKNPVCDLYQHGDAAVSADRDLLDWKSSLMVLIRAQVIEYHREA